MGGLKGFFAGQYKNFSDMVNKEFSISDHKIVEAARLRQNKYPEKPHLLITLEDLSTKRNILSRLLNYRIIQHGIMY